MSKRSGERNENRQVLGPEGITAGNPRLIFFVSLRDLGDVSVNA